MALAPCNSQARHGTLALLVACCLAAFGCGNNVVPKEAHVFQVGELVEISSIAFSADDKFLIAGTRGGASRNDATFWRGQVLVWDLAAEKLVKAVEVPAWVESLAMSPRGDLLALGCFTPKLERPPANVPFEERPGELIVYDFPALQRVFSQSEEFKSCGVAEVRFSPDGKTLATAISTNSAGRVKVWETASWKLLTSIVDAGAPTRTAYSHDGTMLAVTCAGEHWSEGAIRLYDAGTFLKVKEWTRYGLRPEANNIEFLAGGKLLALSTGVGGIPILDLNTGKLLEPKEFAKASQFSHRVVSSRDSNLLVTVSSFYGSTSGSGVAIWDMKENKLVKDWRWMNVPGFTTIALSSDEKHVAVGNNRGEVKVYRVAD